MLNHIDVALAIQSRFVVPHLGGHQPPSWRHRFIQFLFLPGRPGRLGRSGRFNFKTAFDPICYPATIIGTAACEGRGWADRRWRGWAGDGRTKNIARLQCQSNNARVSISASVSTSVSVSFDASAVSVSVSVSVSVLVSVSVGVRLCQCQTR